MVTGVDNTQRLDAQWAEPVSLTFHCALRKLNTEYKFFCQFKKKQK
jgi:azurin